MDEAEKKKQAKNARTSVVIIGILGVAWWFCGDSKPKPPPVAAAPVTPVATKPVQSSAPPIDAGVPTKVSAEDEARFAACQQKLKIAHSLKMLYDFDWKADSAEPRVVVGPTFFDVPFDAKVGLLQTISCVASGGLPNARVSFNLLDWKSNKTVGRYSMGELELE